MGIPLKNRNRTAWWSINPTPRYISKRYESTASKETYSRMVTSALFTTVKESTNVSMNIWMDKKHEVCVCARTCVQTEIIRYYIVMRMKSGHLR